MQHQSAAASAAGSTRRHHHHPFVDNNNDLELNGSSLHAHLDSSSSASAEAAADVDDKKFVKSSMAALSPNSTSMKGSIGQDIAYIDKVLISPFF